MAGIEIDFLSPEFKRRLAARGLKSQPLARAVGFPGPAPRVFDATAGLLRDAMHLVALGCEVVAMERSAQLYDLGKNALDRAARAGLALKGSLDLCRGDSREFLRSSEARGRFDVVYLDPMYSESGKSALPKKEMQALRALLGKEEDGEELFQAALAVRPKRIVVKRGPKAPFLAPNPAHSFRGGRVRFDLYLPA